MTSSKPVSSQIVFFTETEFTQRDYDRFGIQIMRDSGLSVIVFDMSSVYFPELKKNQKFRFEGYFEIKSFREFEALFDRICKSGFVFIFMPLTIKLLPYFKKIWASSFNIVTLRLGTLPASFQANGGSAFNLINYFFRFKELVRIFEISFLNKVTKILKIQKDSLVCICAGKQAEGAYSHYSYLVKTGSMDFNIFLSNPDIGEKKHIVFLDEYEPFHPDFDKLGVEKVNAEKYFKDLNSFFDALESRYNLPVVIAAHPAADLKTYKKYFSGRDVIGGRTAVLIRDSIGVVGHSSTALQLAFLYRKPTCFIVTNDMSHGFRENIFSAYRNYGFSFINISNDEVRKSSELIWDNQLSEKYINDFVISDGTPPINTWVRFVEFVKNREEFET